MKRITVNEKDGLFWKISEILSIIANKFEIGYNKNIAKRTLIIDCYDDDFDNLIELIYDNIGHEHDEKSILVERF